MKLRVLRGMRALKGLPRPNKKDLHLLPHVLTVANLAAGVGSMIMASRGEVYLGAVLILFSVLFDAFDGRLARWLGAEGEFGKHLDSLADVVSFGVAPALLMWQVNLQYLGPWGWAVAIAFPVAGALRLARFNLIKSGVGYFVGLPITAAGGLVTSFLLYGQRLDHWIFPVAMVVLSYLMVSTIRYPDFKKRPTQPVVVAQIAVPTLIAVVAVAWLVQNATPRSLIFIPLLLYATLGVYLHLERSWRQSVRPRLRELALRRRP